MAILLPLSGARAQFDTNIWPAEGKYLLHTNILELSGVLETFADVIQTNRTVLPPGMPVNPFYLRFDWGATYEADTNYYALWSQWQNIIGSVEDLADGFLATNSPEFIARSGASIYTLDSMPSLWDYHGSNMVDLVNSVATRNGNTNRWSTNSPSPYLIGPELDLIKDVIAEFDFLLMDLQMNPTSWIYGTFGATCDTISVSCSTENSNFYDNLVFPSYTITSNNTPTGVDIGNSRRPNNSFVLRSYRSDWEVEAKVYTNNTFRNEYISTRTPPNNFALFLDLSEGFFSNATFEVDWTCWVTGIVTTTCYDYVSGPVSDITANVSGSVTIDDGPAGSNWYGGLIWGSEPELYAEKPTITDEDCIENTVDYQTAIDPDPEDCQGGGASCRFISLIDRSIRMDWEARGIVKIIFP